MDYTTLQDEGDLLSKHQEPIT